MRSDQEFSFGKLCITDHVIFVVFRENAMLDAAAADAIMEARLSLQKGKPCTVLYDLNGLADSDKAGRDHFCITCVASCNAAAFYATGCVQQTIGNLLARQIRPAIPCKAFSSSKAAAAFLDNHK